MTAVKIDPLEYELRYKNDQRVLDLLAAWKDCVDDSEALDNARARADISDAEAQELEEKVDTLETENARLKNLLKETKK